MSPLDLAIWEVIGNVNENYFWGGTEVKSRHQWLRQKMILPHDSSDFECKFMPLRWSGLLKDLLSYMIQRPECDIHYEDIGIHLLGAS